MEEEAGWLSKKEDLQRELSEAYARLDARKEKLLRLQHTPERTNNQFEVQRIELLRRIEEVFLNYILNKICNRYEKISIRLLFVCLGPQ
jgi:hypothetical protein